MDEKRTTQLGPSGSSQDRIQQLEAAIREAQTRALLMTEMRLTDFQRGTLANVMEPLSLVMADLDWEGLL